MSCPSLCEQASTTCYHYNGQSFTGFPHFQAMIDWNLWIPKSIGRENPATPSGMWLEGPYHNISIFSLHQLPSPHDTPPLSWVLPSLSFLWSIWSQWQVSVQYKVICFLQMSEGRLKEVKQLTLNGYCPRSHRVRTYPSCLFWNIYENSALPCI